MFLLCSPYFLYRKIIYLNDLRNADFDVFENIKDKPFGRREKAEVQNLR
jgi:hypothetical protein